MKVTVPNFNKELNSLPKLKAYPRANWKDINFKNNYQHTVELSMQNIPLLDEKNVNKSNALAAVTSYYETLCDAIHLCVASCAAQTKPSGKRKHWWNHNCSKARDRNRLFHHIWKSCGRPSSGAVFDCYRDSRKAYRRACRQAVNSRSKYTANLILQLHRERNQGRLWNVIKHRELSQQPQDNIGIHKLVDFFTLKFGYSPSESTCIHDANQEVSRKYKVLAEQSLSGFTECHVTEQQVRRYIQKINGNSAPGCDGISTEHLKHSVNTKLTAHLSRLFSMCIRYELSLITLTKESLFPS